MRVGALLVLAVAACAEAPAPSAIVEGPVLELTRASLPEELAGESMFRVLGLAATEDGAGEPVVAIADAGNDRLLFWWPDEGRVESFGRSGEGPGEFGSLRGVWATEGTFVVEDAGNRRFAFIDPARGELGTHPRDLANLTGGGALLPEGLFVVPIDDASQDPFTFRRVTAADGRMGLEEAARPDWFPAADSLERPAHPLYEEFELQFPPAGPVSTDVAVQVGDRLAWVQQRTGHLVLLPLDASQAPLESASDAHPEPAVVPIPDAAIGSHVREWVETRGEEGMRTQHFQAFWNTRPDLGRRRALFPVGLSTGQPLGWLLEASGEGGIEGRIVRLASNEELPYRVRAALPLADGRYLVGHEGGVTLLSEAVR